MSVIRFFIIFMIIWHIFTKTKANTRVKVRSKTSLMDLFFFQLMDLFFFQLLANVEHTEYF